MNQDRHSQKRDPASADGQNPAEASRPWRAVWFWGGVLALAVALVWAFQPSAMDDAGSPDETRRRAEAPERWVPNLAHRRPDAVPTRRSGEERPQLRRFGTPLGAAALPTSEAAETAAVDAEAPLPRRLGTGRTPF